MNIDEIKKLELDYPDLVHFRSGADPEELNLLEDYFGFPLPSSLREFLLNFNGGFICDNKLADTIKRDGSTELAEWNSLTIFSVSELFEHYDMRKMQNWKLDDDWDGIYPILPFARTGTQEYLVFIVNNNSDDYSIFDAFHEDPVYDWGRLFNNFEEFIDEYIYNMGYIDCISASDEPTADQFLPESGWKENPEDSEELPKLIAYCNAALYFEGSSFYYYRLRARANLQLKNFVAAETDILSALELEPDDPYAITLYAEILEVIGKDDEALNEYTRAVEIEGDSNNFAISLRANYYLQRGDLKAAVADATKAIEIDPQDAYPYMIRCEAYLKLGMEEEARYDSDKVDELY